jgi:hypothetical protein
MQLNECLICKKDKTSLQVKIYNDESKQTQIEEVVEYRDATTLLKDVTDKFLQPNLQRLNNVETLQQVRNSPYFWSVIYLFDTYSFQSEFLLPFFNELEEKPSNDFNEVNQRAQRLSCNSNQ